MGLASKPKPVTSTLKWHGEGIPMYQHREHTEATPHYKEANSRLLSTRREQLSNGYGVSKSRQYFGYSKERQGRDCRDH